MLTGQEQLVVNGFYGPRLAAVPFITTTGAIASLGDAAVLPAVDIVAAGTNQVTATPMGLNRSYITSGTGGAVLPQAATFNNVEIPVYNRSGATITVYPFLGDTIETNSVNVGVTLTNNQVGRFSVDATGIVRLA